MPMMPVERNGVMFMTDGATPEEAMKQADMMAKYLKKLQDKAAVSGNDAGHDSFDELLSKVFPEDEEEEEEEEAEGEEPILVERPNGELVNISVRDVIESIKGKEAAAPQEPTDKEKMDSEVEKADVEISEVEKEGDVDVEEKISESEASDAFDNKKTDVEAPEVQIAKDTEEKAAESDASDASDDNQTDDQVSEVEKKEDTESDTSDDDQTDDEASEDQKGKDTEDNVTKSDFSDSSKTSDFSDSDSDSNSCKTDAEIEEITVSAMDSLPADDLVKITGNPAFIIGSSFIAGLLSYFFYDFFEVAVSSWFGI